MLREAHKQHRPAAAGRDTVRQTAEELPGDVRGDRKVMPQLVVNKHEGPAGILAFGQRKNRFRPEKRRGSDGDIQPADAKGVAVGGAL